MSYRGVWAGQFSSVGLSEQKLKLARVLLSPSVSPKETLTCTSALASVFPGSVAGVSRTMHEVA